MNFHSFGTTNNSTETKQHIKVVTDGWVIGYAWMLFNDGCWRLGRIVAGYDGIFYWDSITDEDHYCCTTIKCMSELEFDTFC